MFLNDVDSSSISKMNPIKVLISISICLYFQKGLPLVACVVIIGLDRSFYLGDDTYCFVKPGPALYYGVMFPVGLLLVINFIIFVMVVQRLSCRKAISANKTTKNDRKESWRRVQNAVAISVLLGVTWISGLLAIGDARLLFNIIFLIFNSLQGFFIFLMFCVRQKEIRDFWLRCLCCCKCKKQKPKRHVAALATAHPQDESKQLQPQISHNSQPSLGSTDDLELRSGSTIDTGV